MIDEWRQRAIDPIAAENGCARWATAGPASVSPKVDQLLSLPFQVFRPPDLWDRGCWED